MKQIIQDYLSMPQKNELVYIVCGNGLQLIVDRFASKIENSLLWASYSEKKQTTSITCYDIKLISGFFSGKDSLASIRQDSSCNLIISSKMFFSWDSLNE